MMRRCKRVDERLYRQQQPNPRKVGRIGFGDEKPFPPMIEGRQDLEGNLPQLSANNSTVGRYSRTTSLTLQPRDM